MDSVHCGIIEKHSSMKKEKINIEYVLDKVSHMSLWNQLTTPGPLCLVRRQCFGQKQ